MIIIVVRQKKEIISCLIIPNLVTKCVDYRLLLKEEYKEYCQDKAGEASDVVPAD